jgi:HSP20 family molecular chaperone IbpA
MDMGAICDDIFSAAEDFRDEFRRNFGDFDANGFTGRGRGGDVFHGVFDENIDYYPNYSYPPMNVFITEDKSLVFEFALAGFGENDISLSFQGDYMVFSAKLNNTDPVVAEGSAELDEDAKPFNADNVEKPTVHYFKRRLKLKDIEKQKYYVPLDKYAQEKVRAIYKNGILKVVVPPKDEPEQNSGIKIEIVREGK